MVQLDDQEELALKGFLETLEAQSFDPKPKVNKERISRGPEGQIIVPVILQGTSPSLSLALLMGRKADQIYKQTACRFVLAQYLEKDAQMRKYVWVENSWGSIT